MQTKDHTYWSSLPFFADVEETVTVFVQTPPTADEAGHCDRVHVDEIGDTPVVVFKQGEWTYWCLL